MVRTAATTTASTLMLAVGMRAPGSGRLVRAIAGRYEGRRVRPAAQAAPREQQQAGDVHRGADQLVLIEQAESAEQIRPIVLAAAHERQLLGARVPDVDGDVPEGLRDPPQRDGRGVADSPAAENPQQTPPGPEPP